MPETKMGIVVIKKDEKAAPLGSTSRAILIASDVARSWLAGETANMIQLGCS